MSKTKLMIILAIASYCWLAATVILGGIFYPNYAHLSQFMSELGATGSPHGQLVNLAGFGITEILLLGSLAIAFQQLPKTPSNLVGFVFLAVYPILIGVAALSPCDFECRPDTPSLSHLIHITTALLAYLCAIIGLAFLSRQSGATKTSTLLKKSGLLLTPVLLLLFFNIVPENPIVGLVQRVGETLIYIWLVWWLLVLAKNSGAKSTSLLK